MTTTPALTVFGASGRLGQLLLRHLSAAGIPTLAVTRDLARATPLPAVQWVQADMADPASLAPVLQESRTVFLLSNYSPSLVTEQLNVLKVAQRYGQAHVVKLSSGAADSAATAPIARAHGQVEAVLRASGLAWTLLRPEGFMQNWLTGLARAVQHERRIYEATGEGRRPYLDARDVAEVAYVILTNPAPHAKQTYTLTGDEALSYGQVASIISHILGEPVTFVSQTPADARQRLAGFGVPTGVIDTLLDYAESQRSGLAARVSPAVATLLNRPARTVAAFIQEHRQHFA